MAAVDMEMQGAVPINPPQQQQLQPDVPSVGEDRSNNGGGGTQPPPPPTAPDPSAEPAQQQASLPASPAATTSGGGDGDGDGGVGVTASSAAAENHAGDGVASPAPGGAVVPAAEKKEGGQGGSQPQQRSAKRSREASIPVGLPKNMVRRIMKIGEDTRNISNEALVIVVKASELFLERFAMQAFDHAEKLGRKTIKYRDVSDIRVKDPNLLFLEAVVPP
eukprot:g10713.t1